jgi:plasmid stabilization system protein ParE
LKARVVVRRAAELDLETIEDWYESQLPGLGADFRSVVEEAVMRIGENPLAYPERLRIPNGYRRTAA